MVSPTPAPAPPSSLLFFPTTPTTAEHNESSSPPHTAIDSVCIGSGRFLRAVLVPALVASGYHPAIVQTRGRSFLDYCWKDAPESKPESKPESIPNGDESPGCLGSSSSSSSSERTYEIDTVHYDGRIETTRVPCWGAGTLGSPEGKRDVLDLCSKLNNNDDDKPLIVGVGVTEAGLSSASTRAMGDLYDVLVALSSRSGGGGTRPPKICVVNTDNVSKNGDVLRGYMEELAGSEPAVSRFLASGVVFHNTMVDRITSERPGSNGLVPRAEPTPSKALVVEDLGGDLPRSFHGESLRKEFGVVVRTEPGGLDADIALKLRVANGTHTAAAHAMALAGLPTTDALSSSSSSSSLLMGYLDSFFERQIATGVGAAGTLGASPSDARAVYDDWRRRLIHAHFGLSTLFITQNGAAKGGIRIGPTVRDLVLSSSSSGGDGHGHGGGAAVVACSTAFCLAAILRFLTPANGNGNGGTETNGIVYRGWLDPAGEESPPPPSTTAAYADGLSYNLGEGWYEFRCSCLVKKPPTTADTERGGQEDEEERPLPEVLASIGGRGSGRPHHPVVCEGVVRAYLCKADGGDLSSIAHTGAFGVLTKAVAALYARMVAGDGMLALLGEMDPAAGCDCLVDGEFSSSGSS